MFVSCDKIKKRNRQARNGKYSVNNNNNNILIRVLLSSMTTSSTMKPSPIRYARNKKGPKRCRAKIQITSQGRDSKEREAYAKDAIRGLQMERITQTDTFSTAYETAHRKEKVDVQNKKEHDK